MKEGSLVECKSSNWAPSDGGPMFPGLTLPVKEGIYTVRDMKEASGGTYLTFEEIVNPKHRGQEFTFNASSFVELLPGDLNSLVEKIVQENPVVIEELQPV